MHSSLNNLGETHLNHPTAPDLLLQLQEGPGCERRLPEQGLCICQGEGKLNGVAGSGRAPPIAGQTHLLPPRLAKSGEAQ